MSRFDQSHYIKYMRICVFINPYSPVLEQNLWFCTYTGENGSVKTIIVVYFMQWVVGGGSKLPDRFSSGKSSSKKRLEIFKPSRINWPHFINVIVNTLRQRNSRILSQISCKKSEDPLWSFFWLGDKYSKIMEI